MVSYRVMHMGMTDLQQGLSTINDETVQTSYTMTPQDMTMTMHMMSIMHGISNDLTIMMMVPYSFKTMNTVSQHGNTISSMTSEGLNDIQVSGLWRMHHGAHHQVLINTGISLPFGNTSISNNSNQHMPYGMQQGSGTVDILVGSTATAQFNHYTYGAQFNSTLRFGKNRHDYSLGNHYQLSAWLQTVLSPDISTSIRGTTTMVANIDGQDSTVTNDMKNMNPLYNRHQGHITSDLALGINYMPISLPGTRIAGELRIPIFYYTNSIQLAEDYTVSLGIQHSL